MEYNSKGYKVFKTFNYMFLLIFGIVVIFPYVNIIAKALNDSVDTMRGGITFYPRVPTLQNVKIVLADPSIGGAAIISILRVVLGTILALIVQFSAAYAISRKSLAGRNAILLYLTIPMFISGGLMPTYLLFSKIHVLNTFLVYILPTAFSFYNMIIIRTYIYTIPESLMESARIDGANEGFILFRVILPLAMPIIATITLWVAVSHWNDWTSTLYFVTNRKMFTLQYLLMQVIKESERIQSLIQAAIEKGSDLGKLEVKVTSDALRSAQILVTTLPIILVYPWLQKYFIKGVMIGAVKE